MARETPPNPATRDGESRLLRRAHRRSRRRRLVRLALLTLPVLLAIALGGAWLVRGHAAKRVALPVLERSLGFEATCGPATTGPGGVVYLPDLVLRAPGVGGDAGVPLHVERAEISVDWFQAIWDPAGAVFGIRLVSPTVRISRSVVDGSLNIDALTAGAGAATAGTPDLPAIEVQGGRVEFGEHGDGWYAPLNAIGVDGNLVPRRDEPGLYDLTLSEREGASARLEGWLDLERGAGDLRLADADLGSYRVEDASLPVETILRRVRVDGLVPLATLRFGGEEGFRTELDLRGVSVTAPVPRADGEGDRPLRMSDVRGRIAVDGEGLSADLMGWFEDVQGRVEIETDGVTLGSDLMARFVVDEYRLSRDPGLLPYAPPAVPYILDRFSSPEATVNGRVTVRVEDGRLTSSGAFAVRDGRTAFEDFPYPLESISGTISFDETRVWSNNLTAVGPTGAVMEGDILASPPNDDAEITVNVRARGTPVDDVLLEAMPESHRAALRELLSDEAHRAAQDAGLYASTARREEATIRLDSLRAEMEEAETATRRVEIRREIETVERTLARPTFDLGGQVDVDVEVTKRGGEGGDWTWTVDAAAASLGLLPARAPYPMEAQGLALTLGPGLVELDADRVVGLTGARGTLTAAARTLEGRDDLEVDAEVRLDLAPIDRYLLHAASAVGGAPADAVERLGLAGEVDLLARINEGDGGVRTTAEIAFRGVSATPAGAERALARDLGGRLRVAGDRLVVEPTTGRVLGAEARIAGELGGGETDLRVQLNGVSLDAPAGPLIAALAPGRETALERAQAETRPSGRVNLDVRLRDGRGGDLVVEARASEPDALAFDAFGGRVLLDDARGAATFVVGGEPVLRLEGFGGRARYEGRRAGTVRLEGVWPLGATGGERPGLSLAIEEGRFEAPLWGALLGTRGASASAAALWMLDQRIAGRFDADMTLERRGSGAELTGVVRPRSLALGPEGGRVEMAATGGSLAFEPGGGRADAMRVEGDGWNATVSGDWRLGDRSSIELTLGGEGQRLPRELLGVLPPVVGQAIEPLELRVDESFTLERATLRLDENEAGAWDVSYEQRVRFDGASFRVGALVEDAHGALEMMAARSGEALTLEGALTLERFRAAGARMTDGRATLRKDGGDATLLLPSFEARCYGGLVAGSGRLGLGEGGDAYHVEVRCAEVALGELVAGLRGPADAATENRGLLSGAVSFRGRTSDDASRRARGLFTVRGGQVLRMPLLTPILELGNLQPPTGERLDEAVVDLHLAGDRVVFDRLYAQSETLLITAEGEILLPGFGLDLTVSTRGRRRIPLLSDILDALRNELVSTRVGGTLADPTYTIVQLPGASAAIEGLVGGEPAGGRTRTTPRPPAVGFVPSRPEPRE